MLEPRKAPMGLGAAVSTPQPDQLPNGQVGRIPETKYQPPRQGEQNQGKRASPEQQEMYNKFVGAGMNMLFGNDRFFDAASQMIDKAENLIDAVAGIAAKLVSYLFGDAKKKGVDIDGAVVLHGGAELYEHVKDMVTAKTGHQFGPEESEQGFYKATDLVRSILQGQGLINKETGQATIAEFEALEQRGELSAALEYFRDEGAQNG